MNHAAIIPTIVLLFAHSFAHQTPKHFAGAATGSAQNPLRVAVIGFARQKGTTYSHQVEAALTEALSRDARVTLIDQSLAQPALVGIGYDGSINMSKDEARGLGAAIGCDFFIVGKSEMLTRSSRENESYEEAYAGVMLVDARSGSLAAFDFVAEKGVTREGALNALVKTLSARA